VTIRRSFIEINGAVEIGPTKTKGSRRLVDIGQIAVDALKERAAKAEAEGSTLLFGTTLGTEMRRSNLRRSHFEPILEEAKLGHLRIHDLRHSMTSLGIAEGVGVKVLAERLGHSTTRLTADRYAHILPGVGRIAAAAIDAVLTEKKPRTRAKKISAPEE
jgi:integrase